MSDLDYFRSRLAYEERMIDMARCREAEVIHRDLSTRYARLALKVIQSGPDGSMASPSLKHGLQEQS